MYVRQRIRPRVVWDYAWRSVLRFTLYSALVIYLYDQLALRWLAIPWQPVATLGIAVSFYVGFKSNSSYDRFWEARQLWGSIVNASRLGAVQMLDFVEAPSPEESADLTLIHRRLLFRHVAWCNALRLHLRRQPDLWASEVALFLDPLEAAEMQHMENPPAQLLRGQSRALKVLRRQHMLDEFRYLALIETMGQLYNFQGGCERIKNTPYPRQYAFFSWLFVEVFILLLPLGLLGEFARWNAEYTWFVLPLSVLVSFVFNTIEVAAHISENPFENQINDVPMTSLCRAIEIDLRQMLGDVELPPRVEAQNDILL